MFSIQRPIPAAKNGLKPGLRPLGVLLAALALMMGLAGPAAAQSTTVRGTGALVKMSVNNGQGAVVARLFGDGGKCDPTRSVRVVLRDADGTRYTADGACFPGDPASGGGWHKSLSRGTRLVSCAGYKLTYDVAGKFWRFEIPRTCLAGLANRIKVNGDMSMATVATVNEAGPTPWLLRG